MLLINIRKRSRTLFAVFLFIHTNNKELQNGWIIIMSEACEREARSLALEKAYVHQVYQQISNASDSLPDKGKAWPRVKQFLSELEPGSLVCDVGCGNGKYLDVNPSVFEIGADRCKRLTEVAREKEHEVLMCDNLALPFRDESFDAVLSIAVVHHFATTDRRVQALRELARVLRIGGKLIISVWAMEQRHRKFESQDVLVPWHRPQHLSTPSLEFTSTTTTTTTTTSEEDGPPPYHAYTQTSDSESARSQRTSNCVRKRGRNRHKGRSIDPARPLSSSQSSSSLSSPNETCYSFVRRALQKLAGGKRGGSGRHRPWFLETWSTCTKEPPPRRYDPDGCEDIDVEDIQDLPIELRRLEEETDLPQRRQTFACSERLSSSVEVSLGYKSKSLSDILTINQKCMVRSRSSVSSLDANGGNVETKDASSNETTNETTTEGSVITSQPKPKLVKQKQSLCEEEMEEEGGDQPTDMRDLVKRLPEFKVSISGGSRRYGSVFKQSSMNEELMSTERLREKERVRQNIQKQASLNEEFLFRRQRTFDSLRDTFFSTSTARRFQLLKDGLTNKIKNSTTGIEKVTGASFKNGFVRILQGWKSDASAPQPRPTPPTPPPFEVRRANTFDQKNGNGNGSCTVTTGERRHSKEDGSDSSKDSSLQSDTSVDSEDSFASVIFIPKPDPSSETSPPTNISPPTAVLSSPTLQSLPQSPQPTSPKLKNSLPTSPKFKYQSPTSPIIKQPSLPCKYQTPTSPNFKTQLPTSPIGLTKQHSLPTSPKFKYQMPPLSPGFVRSNEFQMGFQQKLNLLNFQQKSQSPGFSAASTDLDSSALIEQPTAKTPPALTDVPTISETKVKPQSPKSETETVCGTGEPVKKEVAAEEAKTEGQIHLSDNFKSKQGLSTRQSFPLVRRAASSGANGRQENLAKPLPKLLSLELFNPETDDVDSDSSGVSSPDSVSSVISVLTEELSVESHDAQQTKPSPSDGHSNSTSNSINDSDLNLSDQSISSLPNSKSPEFLTSKSPENVSKSSRTSSNSSKSSGTKKIEESKSSSKSSKSPENLSSSSESLSKSVDAPKEEESKTSDNLETKIRVLEVKPEEIQGSKIVEKHSTKSPETTKPKPAVLKTSKDSKTTEDSVYVELEKQIRTRDEKFVTAACEIADEKSLSPTKKKCAGGKSSSPSKSLIEAAADVASSLEGAVDAVIQSSPRARRKQLELMETSNPSWVIEGDYPGTHSIKAKLSPEKEDDPYSTLFKKCEVKPSLKIRHDVARKRSPEYLSSHDEPYPDFEFCKIKEDKARQYGLEKFRPDRPVSIENVPLLSSFDRGSNQSLGCYDMETEYLCQKSETERLKKEKRRRNPESSETVPRSMVTGSSWSLGRSDRFRACSSDVENERPQRNTSTWSLNRYETIAKIPLGDFYAKAEGTVRKVGRFKQEAEDYQDLLGDVGKFSEKTLPVPERPIVRIIHEDLSVSTDDDDECDLGSRHRRNYRSHSLSLNNADRLRNIGDRIQTESWDEECRQHLAEFDRLSEKLLAEIDQYRERTVQVKTDSRPIFSSLPAGLEFMHDPYLTRLSEELLDLTRLSAELKERNSYLASLSDEDINKELKISSRKTETKAEKKTNPFLTSLNNETLSSSNPFSSRLISNPFLTDPNESEFDPFCTNNAADAVDSNGQSHFDDSFVPFEIDSPPKNRKASITIIQSAEPRVTPTQKIEPGESVTSEALAKPSSLQLESRTIEGREEIIGVEVKIDSSSEKPDVEKSSDMFEFELLIRPLKEKRQNLLFIKSASLDDSHRIAPQTNDGKDFAELTRSKLSEKNQKIKSDLEILSQKVKAMSSKEQKSEKSRSDNETKSEIPSNLVLKEQSNGKSSDAKIPSSESLADNETNSKILSNPFRNSVESNDQDGLLDNKKDVRVSSLESSVDADTVASIQRDTSRVTIASSLGHSMESSDPEASVGTYSGSECSRRDVSHVTASTASLDTFPGHSMESSDLGDVSERTGSGSDFSRKETSSGGTGRTAGSTASLDPESSSEFSKDARHADRRTTRCDGRSSSEEIPRKIQLVRQKTAVQETLDTLTKAESFETSLNGSTSQESLPSDNGGGAITFHRYYHVFREGELDQLIEKYVDNLHIISSYYDHANWCVIAEKVQVWTI